MKPKDIQFFKDHSVEKGKKSNYYNNTPMFSADNVHEKIFSALSKGIKNKNSKIIVLGSGAGAFEERLLDNGFKNITSVDIVSDNFLIKEISVTKINLNNDFSNIGKFDVVVAIEVIEHLENQFNFIRCVKKIMNEDGVFYLTTPNIENTFTRMRYFFLGTLYYFGESELYGIGHISPIFKHILEYNLSQNNLKIRKYFGNTNIWFKLFKNKNIFKKIIFVSMSFIILFMKRKNNFKINLFEIINAD